MVLPAPANLGIGATTFGTAATSTLGIASGTAPTTRPADMVQMWVEDTAAGDARLHILGEAAGGEVTVGDGDVFADGDMSVGGSFVLPNLGWLKGWNYAGSDYVNMFRITIADEIECAGSLIAGPIIADEDSGAITMMDMPVSATPAAGTEESYAFKVDGDNLLTVMAEADSAGGIQNPKVVAHCGVNLKEITTPTAKANYGALYTKSDNKLYFQDGAGTEHTVTIS